MPRHYLDESYSEIAHVMSYLDRNSASATYGCFDRRYWSWRIGDMANASLQYGMYPLAWLWKHDDTGAYKGAGNVLEWIQAAIRFTAKIQKGNGSFNQFFLNEQSVGTTYYLLSAMLNIHDMLREALAHDVHDALE